MSPEQREEKARFRQEVRARISLIATERGLPKAETAKVMGRLATRDVIDFIVRHHIDANWLLCGDLKGLLRMVRNRQNAPHVQQLNRAKGEPTPAA
jgi:hypothetical protein